VLEGVVLGLRKDVEAQHGFQQGRIPERQGCILVFRQVKADRQSILF
jgi:hypothetical protein